MELHHPTLMLTNVLVSAVMAIAILFVSYPKKSGFRGLRIFSASLLLNAAGYLLFLLRVELNLPDLLWIVVGNSLVSCAGTLLLFATNDVLGCERWKKIAWAPAILATLVVFILTDQPRTRISIYGLIVSAQLAWVIYAIWSSRRNFVSRGVSLINIGVTVLFIASFTRAIISFNTPSNFSGYTSPGVIQTTFLCIFFISLLIISTGFFLAETEISLNRLQQLAARDGLTGIANRRQFDALLASEWARAERSGQPLAIGMLDVDHFKKYNDNYGHQAGDNCLKKIADTLQGCIKRSGDVVARYGGEEFVFIAPGADGFAAIELAQRACIAIHALNLPHEHSEHGHVTVSIGVISIIPNSWNSPDAMLKRADEALYHAKKAGRNQIFYGGDLIPEKQTNKFLKISWSSSYNSGNKIIDQRHQELFMIANALLDAAMTPDKNEAGKSLACRLIEKLSEHFQEEEEILRELSFPDLEAHTIEHGNHLAKARELAAQYQSGELRLGALFEFLVHDIINGHLLGKDTDYFGLTRSETA